MADLKNNDLPRRAYANVCTLFGSQANGMRAASCVPHLATLLMTQWILRVICGDVLYRTLGTNLVPSWNSCQQSFGRVCPFCSFVIHPAMTPEEGFLQFLENVYRLRIEFPFWNDHLWVKTNELLA